MILLSIYLYDRKKQLSPLKLLTNLTKIYLNYLNFRLQSCLWPRLPYNWNLKLRLAPTSVYPSSAQIPTCAWLHLQPPQDNASRLQFLFFQIGPHRPLNVVVSNRVTAVIWGSNMASGQALRSKPPPSCGLAWLFEPLFGLLDEGQDFIVDVKYEPSNWWEGWRVTY